MDDDRTEANRRNWDERVAVHPGTDYYDVDGFLDGASSLYALERDELADVVDEETELLHLMCHFGLDTLSWARTCRSVVGVDFSPAAVEKATDLAETAGLDDRAEFVEGNVLDVDLGRQFDVVFNTFGVLGWLEDVEAWADTVARHLRPGGTFYFADVHPVAGCFTHVDADGASFGGWSFSYFREEPMRFDVGGSYADPDAEFEHTEQYEYQHTLGEAVSALASRDLDIEFLHEFPWADFELYDGMEEGDDGRWWLPEDVPVELPLTVSLRAQKRA
ncbi:class I SAM-dependent methyltransferase [Haloarchaeobius sp. HRN-SO-5]|uniref:class I SAM-dependent methyltransferase n=1 Tax=Haloarchaeobius sp. HRN-SO-5 TaxID=3446118 RepID=UPI003EBD52DF